MNRERDWRFPDARVLVFARAPWPGEVKTRLAESIGQVAAANAYAAWFFRFVETVCEAAIAPVELWVSPDTRHALFLYLAEEYGVSLNVQPRGNLGRRMNQVLAYTLERRTSAVLVGSDCPVMQPDYIVRAFESLCNGIDPLFGPAEDGGYVLVGMNRPRPEVFSHIPWSTANVMRATRQQLIKSRQSWGELETLWDIDTVEDYRRWQSRPADSDNKVGAMDKTVHNVRI